MKKKRPTKFLPGETIIGIDNLAGQLDEGKWIYYWGVPKHPGFIVSMTFKTIINALSRHQFQYSTPNPEYHPIAARKP